MAVAGGNAASAPAANVAIVASDGSRIPAHAGILASASPVLETMVMDAHRGWNADRAVRIPGVPSDALAAFVRLLYLPATAKAEREVIMEQHAVPLLALAHAYRVGWLKTAAERAVASRLTADDAADMLKLASMCNAWRLYHRCVRLAAQDFDAVSGSDGWRFMSRHDPALELDILQILEDDDQRKKRWRKEREARELYLQLADAMDCLDHIFPADGAVASARCEDDAPCRALQPLMRHLAACDKNLSVGKCAHCRRAWRLLRLHSAVCVRTAGCRVPMCGHWRARPDGEDKAGRTWRLLAKKVASARLMASVARRSKADCPPVVKASLARYRRPSAR